MNKIYIYIFSVIALFLSLNININATSLPNITEPYPISEDTNQRQWDYQEGVTYKEGDLVKHNDKFKVVVTDFTSNGEISLWDNPKYFDDVNVYYVEDVKMFKAPRSLWFLNGGKYLFTDEEIKETDYDFSINIHQSTMLNGTTADEEYELLKKESDSYALSLIKEAITGYIKNLFS